MDDNSNTTPKLHKVIPEAMTVRPSFSGDNEDAEDIFKSEAPDSTAICPLAATSTRMLLMIPYDRGLY